MRRLLAALVVAVLLAAGAAWGWRTGRLLPPDPEIVSGVDPADLAAALRLDPAAPLRAGETDVVLVVACTLRRDRLEPYGQERPTSPFLERLAASGVRFEEHFSQAPWTRPSVGAILTGRWPRPLRLDNPGPHGSFGMVLGEEHTTLAETFAAAGYRTFGATGNPNIKALFGFGQGFEAYVDPEFRWTRGQRPKLDDAGLVDAALEFAGKLAPDERLYARLVLTSTHLPRHYTRRDLGLLAGERSAAIEEYDASVRYLDAQLARLLVGIKKTRPNVLFVLVADHGEGLRLPAHHDLGHGRHVYQTTLRVPFLLHHPALPAGHAARGLSMNIDVHPTILDLLGLPLGAGLDGRSQAAAARGGAASGHAIVFAESFYQDVHKSAALDGARHLVRDHATETDRLYAYDQPTADQELEDRPSLLYLSEALDAWEARMAASQGGPGREVELDEETRRQLEAMGYVE